MRENTTVELVEACATGLRVVTDQQTWLARNVVVATGTENRAFVPPVARGLAPRVHQLTAGRYRSPQHVPDGGVLVVGPPRRACRSPTSCVAPGEPSSSRSAGTPGSLGATAATTSSGGCTTPASSTRGSTRCGTHGRPAGRRRCSCPAAAAIGSTWKRSRHAGVILAGRLTAADGWSVAFADDLPATTGAAQARMDRLLRSIEAFIAPGTDDQADPLPAFTALASRACLTATGR